jgi:hypothetical protein
MSFILLNIGVINVVSVTGTATLGAAVCVPALESIYNNYIN